MQQYAFIIAGLVAVSSLAGGGCRSCSDCHDYDPPVANCECDSYGTHRSGSATAGCATGSCGCGGHGGGYGVENYGGSEGEYVEGEYTESEIGGGYPMEGQ